ncbi:MAG TPA: pyridoxal-phosphate dependent enzyme [Steroidobacter sp.]
MTSPNTNDVRAEALELWLDYRPTPLIELPGLAREADVARVLLKLESERPLRNFKALGGMIAGLRALARASGSANIRELLEKRRAGIALPALVCASDGNHGLAVTAAAERAGTKSVVYLPASTDVVRIARIKALGGEVVLVKGTYDDAVVEASRAAARGDGLLIADTSPDPNDPVVRDVLSGYGLIASELLVQFAELGLSGPTHVFVQAGVGGLAAAVAQGLRGSMQEPKKLIVVEPASAACVGPALQAGQPVQISGDLHTSAEMLSCGMASASALQVLLANDATAITVGEGELSRSVQEIERVAGVRSTPSGAAGLAGFLSVASDADLRAQHGLSDRSNVLLILSEAAVNT